MQSIIHNSENPSQVDNPLAELKTWLCESAARCRAMRWLGALFRIEVAQDIVADVALSERKTGTAVYASEQYDLAAEKELDAAKADLEAAVRATPIDPKAILNAIRRIKAARRMVDLSARKDHEAAERLLSCTC